MISTFAAGNRFIPSIFEGPADSKCRYCRADQGQDNDRSRNSNPVTIEFCCEYSFVKAEDSEFGKSDREHVNILLGQTEFQPYEKRSRAQYHHVTASSPILDEDCQNQSDIIARRSVGNERQAVHSRKEMIILPKQKIYAGSIRYTSRPFKVLFNVRDTKKRDTKTVTRTPNVITTLISSHPRSSAK